MKLKAMGVMNLTPNSFSDGGEISSVNLKEKIHFFNQFDILDVGAESTAPMNTAISQEEEWERLSSFIKELPHVTTMLSLDTYHPETIFKFAEIHKAPFIWNDVSGKFDSFVEKFLEVRKDCFYVFSHNLSPSRLETIRHTDFVSSKREDEFLEHMVNYFLPYKRERVIFDPCLGFSKDYDQNWFILQNFQRLIEKLNWEHWLLGFSRKSFLRKKYHCDLSRKSELDDLHITELQNIFPLKLNELIIRTHRPELLAKILV